MTIESAHLPHIHTFTYTITLPHTHTHTPAFILTVGHHFISFIIVADNTIISGSSDHLVAERSSPQQLRSVVVKTDTTKPNNPNKIAHPIAQRVKAIRTIQQISRKYRRRAKVVERNKTSSFGESWTITEFVYSFLSLYDVTMK